MTFLRPPRDVLPGDDLGRRFDGVAWRVLDTMIRHATGDSLTSVEVAKLAGVGERTPRRWLLVLEAEGVVQRLGVGGRGRGRKERWTMAPGMPEALKWRSDWIGLAAAAERTFAADRDAFLERLAPAWTEIDHDTGEVRAHPSLVERGSTLGRFALARAARVRLYGDDEADDDEEVGNDDGVAAFAHNDDAGGDIGEDGD